MATNGGNSSITVSTGRFELDPPIEIEAGQRVADVISVDVLFMERTPEAGMIPHLRQPPTDIA